MTARQTVGSMQLAVNSRLMWAQLAEVIGFLPYTTQKTFIVKNLAAEFTL